MNTDILTQETLVLIKPDAIKRNLIGTILARYEARGLAIVDVGMFAVDRTTVDMHYQEHAANDDLMNGLRAFFVGEYVMALILQGPNAIAAARAINGATDPLKAEPGTIRGDFGAYISRNLVHASDSSEAAKREIGLWFGERK